MWIKHLKIDNFRCVAHYEGDLAQYANVIVGVNGAGKTTLLHAMGILLSWFVARLRSANGKGVALTDNDITDGETHCCLEAEMDDGTIWRLAKARTYAKDDLFARTELKALSVYAGQTKERGERECHIPVVASYDVLRAVDCIPARVRKRHALGMYDIYDDRNAGIASLNSFFVWFREREDDENATLRRTGILTEDPQLKAVRRAVSQCVEGFNDLRAHGERHRGFVITKHGTVCRVDDLSDGEKSYLALVGDIARKLAMANPKADDPLAGSGVVLIDEVDLHLHPEWQRDIVARLRGVFPNVQFVLSTHSPYVLSSVLTQTGENRVFVARRGQVSPAEANLYGSEVSQILAEAFDMTSLRAPEAQRHIDAIWQRIGDPQANPDEYEEDIEWLRLNLSPNDIVFTQIAVQSQLNAARTR